jgi:hypothetical protein
LRLRAGSLRQFGLSASGKGMGQTTPEAEDSRKRARRVISAEIINSDGEDERSSPRGLWLLVGP